MPESAADLTVTVAEALLKSAVREPGPPTVAVVEVEVEEAIEIEELEAVHETKAYPEAGEAAIERLEPAPAQKDDPAVGSVLPPLPGLAVIDTWKALEKETGWATDDDIVRVPDEGEGANRHPVPQEAGPADQE